MSADGLRAATAPASSPETVATLSSGISERLCGWCRGRLSGRRHQRYCGAACRTAAHNRRHPRVDLASLSPGLQRRLGFDPAPEPVQPLGASPEAIRAAQKPQTVRVLRRLQEGPATTGDFLRMGIGRFGARIDELRRVGWEISTELRGEHEAVYTLTGRR